MAGGNPAVKRTQLIALATLAGLSAAGLVASASGGTGGRTGRALPRAADSRGAPVAGGAAHSAAVAAPPVTIAAPATTTSAPRGRRGSGEPVTFAFGGDVHFESYLRTHLSSDPTGMLAPIAPILTGADLAIVNLETAITERGTAADKAYTFRVAPAALTALHSAGVDVASMANNHGLDFGPVGFLDSIAAAHDAGFPIIGIGGNADTAYAPYTVTIRGQRVAVIGASQVIDSALMGEWAATDEHGGMASAYDADRLVRAVSEARPDADTLVVFLHWGTEKMTCPQERQTTLARRLVDAGADIVVGGHSHRLQGAGRLDAAVVDYGLGNFVWYAHPGASAETGVLLVTATGRDIDGYEWKPAVIRNGVPNPLEGAEATAALESWEALRTCTGLAP